MPKVLCVISGKGPGREAFERDAHDRRTKEGWNWVGVWCCWVEVEDYPKLLGKASFFSFLEPLTSCSFVFLCGMAHKTGAYLISPPVRIAMSGLSWWSMTHYRLVGPWHLSSLEFIRFGPSDEDRRHVRLRSPSVFAWVCLVGLAILSCFICIHKGRVKIPEGQTWIWPANHLVPLFP